MSRGFFCAVFFVGSCFFVGCADDAPPHIETVFDPCEALVVDADGDADEVASVAVGLDIWNSGAGAHLQMKSDAINVDAAELPVRFDAAGAAFHGYYDDADGVVFVNDDIASDHARAITVAHEIGHAFGLFHVSKKIRPSLMNDGNTSVGLNDDDVASLVALWGECPRD